MNPETLIASFTSDLSSILADVYVVFMDLINVLIVLVGGRIIYAAIKQVPIIPSRDREYDGMVDQEEEKYHQGILRGNAKYEVSERHKYDL